MRIIGSDIRTFGVPALWALAFSEAYAIYAATAWGLDSYTLRHAIADILDSTVADIYRKVRASKDSPCERSRITSDLTACHVSEVTATALTDAIFAENYIRRPRRRRFRTTYAR